ncbi:hypothetical protein DSO57_1008210 [Entomophthora muscae]|uniref:Uncharacterized protein n=1 Tax=Entomophthora muscae TaxID=34485 RepID=A0ACC2SW10_9FUNG|nr:hypothetical protein DSO57_1008210 [Entomophthora muscae]
MPTIKMCHEPYQAPSTAKTLATCPINNAQAARSAHPPTSSSSASTLIGTPSQSSPQNAKEKVKFKADRSI